MPKAELTELMHWLLERDSQIWDREIEAEVLAGRLEFLIDESPGEKGGA